VCKKYIDKEPCCINVNIGKPRLTRCNMLISRISACNLENPNKLDQKLIIQTPKMQVPFGISSRQMYPEDEPRYDVQLNFDLSKTTHKTLYNNIRFIETVVKKHIKSDCLTYLRKNNISDEALDEYFCSAIKHHKDRYSGEIDDKYPPTIRFRLKTGNNGNKPSKKVLVFNKSKKLVDYNDLLKGNLVQPRDRMFFLFQVSSVWASSRTRRFGINYNVLQIKYEKNIERVLQEEYAFDDSAE